MFSEYTVCENLLAPALEQSVIAVVLIDEQDRVLFFNHAAEKLWGYGRGEVIGGDVSTLVPGSLRDKHAGFLRNNREGGQPRIVGMSRDLELERKDGSRIWARFSLSKVDLDGRIHYMGFARDVSVEIAHREENRLLLLAIDHTDRTMLVLDADRQIIHANRAFTQLLGYEVAEVIGRSADAYLPLSSAGEDAPARHKDGHEVWVRVSTNIISQDDGAEIRNIVVSVSDVTEERHIRMLERDILAALSSSISYSELGNFICRRIEKIAPGVLVSICRVADRKLRPWAGPSFHASYGPDWEGVEIGEGVAGCGTAAHRGEPVMVYDIETDPLWAPYKHQMLPHGYKACWTYPLKRRDGSVAGTFAFYFKRGGKPDRHLERIADASVHLCMLAIERVETQDKISRISHFDSLTGLPNRTHLNNGIDGLLTQSAGNSPIAFVVFDLDRFRDVNESLGHTAGDQLLIAVANRLGNLVPDKGLIARFGENSFMIVAPGCDVRGASILAGRMLEVLKAPFDISGLSLSVTASIGISLFPDNGTDRQSLVEQAETAMARIKTSGAGAYFFFSPEMNDIARNRIVLGAALRNAIATGALELHYQPQLRLDGALHGVEALVRWHDPERGHISPVRFIPLAEEIGEIEAIGHWSLEEACRQMAEWRRSGEEIPRVSVNLSPLHFRNRKLPEFIAGLLRKHDLPSACLTIEITESTMMNRAEETLEILHTIRTLGVGLAMDDFGTGYSSLSSLAALPFTELKLDRSFVSNLEKDEHSQVVATAVIHIGESLGLTVVAEGVETHGQAKLLADRGNLVIQGFLHSPALPAEGLLTWWNGISKNLVRTGVH